MEDFLLEGLKEASTKLPSDLFRKLLVFLLLTSLYGLWKIVSPICGLIWPLIRSYDLKGMWIGTCKMEHYGKDDSGEIIIAIEVYRIVQRGEDITFSFFNYLPDSTRQSIRRFVGSGIFRSNYLSAFYHSPEHNDATSGTFTLRVVQERLNGDYSQFDFKAKGEPLVRSSGDFSLRRLDDRWWANLRMMCKRPPFSTYHEAWSILNPGVAA